MREVNQCSRTVESHITRTNILFGVCVMKRALTSTITSIKSVDRRRISIQTFRMEPQFQLRIGNAAGDRDIIRKCMLKEPVLRHLAICSHLLEFFKGDPGVQREYTHIHNEAESHHGFGSHQGWRPPNALCSDTRADWDGRILTFLCRGVRSIFYRANIPSLAIRRFLPKDPWSRPSVPREEWVQNIYKRGTYTCPKHTWKIWDSTAKRYGITIRRACRERWPMSRLRLKPQTL